MAMLTHRVCRICWQSLHAHRRRIILSIITKQCHERRRGDRSKGYGATGRGPEIAAITSNSSSSSVTRSDSSTNKQDVSRQTAYLGKHFESRRGIARSCDHDLRVLHSRPSVLVVLVRRHVLAALVVPFCRLGQCQGTMSQVSGDFLSLCVPRTTASSDRLSAHRHGRGT